MTKRHHQTKEEQIHNKAHGAQPFHFEKQPYRANEAAVKEINPTQMRAYQIYRERYGFTLENWLESEPT